MRALRTVLSALVLLAGAGGCGGGGGGTPTMPPPMAGITFTPAGGGGANSISLATNPASTAGTLLLDVQANGAADLYAVAFNLSYPSQILSFQGATEGTLLNGQGMFQTSFQAIESPKGTLVVGLSRLGVVPGASGSGALMTLRFSSAAAGNGSFTFARNLAYGPTGAPQVLTWSGGTVQVTGGT